MSFRRGRGGTAIRADRRRCHDRRTEWGAGRRHTLWDGAWSPGRPDWTQYDWNASSWPFQSRRSTRAIGLSGAVFRRGRVSGAHDQVTSEYGADPLVNKIIEFIRAGKRPLTMAVMRNAA